MKPKPPSQLIRTSWNVLNLIPRLLFCHSPPGHVLLLFAYQIVHILFPCLGPLPFPSRPKAVTRLTLTHPSDFSLKSTSFRKPTLHNADHVRSCCRLGSSRKQSLRQRWSCRKFIREHSCSQRLWKGRKQALEEKEVELWCSSWGSWDSNDPSELSHVGARRLDLYMHTSISHWMQLLQEGGMILSQMDLFRVENLHLQLIAAVFPTAGGQVLCHDGSSPRSITGNSVTYAHTPCTHTAS